VIGAVKMPAEFQSLFAQENSNARNPCSYTIYGLLTELIAGIDSVIDPGKLCCQALLSIYFSFLVH
jgi:hypothetical protein